MKTFGVTDYTNKAPLKGLQPDGQTDQRMDGRSGRFRYSKAGKMKMGHFNAIIERQTIA